jgi:hypothetical protein
MTRYSPAACRPPASVVYTRKRGSLYTQDSSICRAALHAGAVGAGGGVITLRKAAGCSKYKSSTENGVTTGGWGAYTGSVYFTSAGDGECAQ